jgi:hypothetical protein
MREYTANVCFWGVKRTWASAVHMSAFDPKRTLGWPDTRLNHMPTAAYSPKVEYAVQLIGINPGPCRKCGGELELKAIIARVAEVPETRYLFLV